MKCDCAIDFPRHPDEFWPKRVFSSGYAGFYLGKISRKILPEDKMGCPSPGHSIIRTIFQVVSHDKDGAAKLVLPLSCEFKTGDFFFQQSGFWKYLLPRTSYFSTYGNFTHRLDDPLEGGLSRKTPHIVEGWSKSPLVY